MTMFMEIRIGVARQGKYHSQKTSNIMKKHLINPKYITLSILNCD